jgi:hypothetical protein
MNALSTHDSTTEEPQDSPDSPTTLEDIIEEEPTRLLTAGTVLGCTSVAIENDRVPTAMPSTMPMRSIWRER